MSNSKKETSVNVENTPLFTGDYRHDTAVSETEKAAEVSQAIYNALKNKIGKKKTVARKLGE